MVHDPECCLSECSMWAWEECVFCHCWVDINVSYLQWFDGGCRDHLCLDLSPVCVYFWQKGVEVSSCHCRFTSFSLQLEQVLPHAIWYSVRQVHLNCYIFLENWSLYHYVMPFLMSGNSPWFGDCFMWKEYRCS